MLFTNIVAGMTLVASCVKAQTYSLNYTYDASNWYDAWTFEDLPDPTHGLVDYQNLQNAQSLGLTKIINNQVYMGVDNTTVMPNGSTDGRKSIWLESKHTYEHYLMIADFEHMPGSDCGTWPGFWSINQDAYGEIDIVEGANDQSHNCMTLHTLGECSFFPRNETGITNGEQCGLQQGDGGCDTQGGQYGTAFNEVGGGVYATLWNSAAIQVFFWERADIPQDITSNNPDPSTWGIPLAQFAGANGGCDIDTNFRAQTIYFDTTFCGANAGGDAWTKWSTCSQTTGYSTCEDYVNEHPEAFDDAYWLVNYVKVFMETSSSAPAPSAPVTSSSADPVSSSAASPTASPSLTLVQPSQVPTISSDAPSSTLVQQPSSVSTVSSATPSSSTLVQPPPASSSAPLPVESSVAQPITTSSVATQSGSSSTPSSPASSVAASQLSSSTPTSTGQAASPSSTMQVSNDGSCGTGVTCEGSVYGDCCSAKGFCGSSFYYCGEGCQAAFGSCPDVEYPDPVITVTVIPYPSSTPVVEVLKVSDYGNCGGSTNTTCETSVYGNCCSQWGFCGSSDAYCGEGCQSGFGSCT